MVSRLTGGTVKPGPGYNTGTLKSNISGFSRQSGDEPKIEDLFSDETSSSNSDDLPLPTPTQPRKPQVFEKPPAIPSTKPVSRASLEAKQAAVSPFEGIKLKPIQPRAPQVSPPVSNRPFKPIMDPLTKALVTDDDVLSDASNTDSLSDDLGDTSAQDSDWPPPKPIKPKVIPVEPVRAPISIIKPTLSSNQPVPGSFTKQPLPIRPITPKVSQPLSKSPLPKNASFDQLKPLSPKKKEEPLTDFLSDASDSNSSVISDGMTTGHDSDYLTTV